MTTAARTDLLELSIEAMTALANPGFVKRAQKDIAAGVVPHITELADKTVQAQFDDGVITTIKPQQSLKESNCSCPASGMCRHRVMLVLAYQACQSNTVELGKSEWNLAVFTDDVVAQTFSASTIEQARKQALSHPVANISFHDDIPCVKLAMNHVRFFSKLNLALAQCDCQVAQGCVHVVLAIWACRIAHGKHTQAVHIRPFAQMDNLETPRCLQSADAQQLIADIEQWLWQIWRSGLSQPLLVLEAGYQKLLLACTKQNWTWVASDLETIWLMLHEQAMRSSRFDIQHLLAVLAGLWARLNVAQQADLQTHPNMPAKQIIGLGQPGEVALDHMCLIPLGGKVWANQQQNGIDIVYADPDTMALSVLSRSWSLADTTPPLQRRIANNSVVNLMAGQVISKAIKRRANGLIELGSRSRQTSVLPLSNQAWQALQAPIRFQQISALKQHLQQLAPTCLRPSAAADGWFVIDIGPLKLQGFHWDARQQMFYANWDNQLICQLPFNQHTPHAIDVMARVLRGDWGALSSLAGMVTLQQGRVHIHPTAIMTTQRAMVLAVEAAPETGLALPGGSIPADSILDETTQKIAQLLRTGLRHMSASQMVQQQQCAQQLIQSGFPKIAELLIQSQHDLLSMSHLILLLNTCHAGNDTLVRASS